MPLDRSAFVGNFIDETKDNIRRVDDGVVKLKKDPENEEELNAVLRALHTIKGSGRMLKFLAMEQIAHGSESLFKGIREQRYPLSSAIMQLVFQGNNLLRTGLDRIRADGSDSVSTERYLAACERAYSNEPFAEDLEALREAGRTTTSAEDTAGEARTDATGAGGARASQPETGAAGAGAAPAPRPGAAAPGATGGSASGSPAPGSPAADQDTGYESIRVRLSNVSQIIETLNTVIIKQFQFKQIQEELSAIEGSFGEYLGVARKRIGTSRDRSVREESAAFVSQGQDLLKSVQNLRKGFVDQMAVLEQNSYKLQEQVMKLSMLPMDLILGELPRMVAETAVLVEKEIDFSISGSDILMDKAILENLNDPILHLVRNAVDHGIEVPAERESAGKEPTGTISVTCSSEGGNIIIRISDDGKGIDHEQVLRRAVERGLVAENDAEALTENEILSFIFVAGFSTKSAVTDLSGRGVGLDIVKHNIDKVKGKVDIESTPGRGSVFTLAVPLSLATVSGFFVRAGGEKFLIPSNFVQKIVRLAPEDRIVYYNKEAFKLENQIVPIYSLAALIGRKPQNRGTHLYVVVVESMGDRVGVVVDAVLQHAALIYKPVPRNMQKIRLIQGIVFDESYRIINILFVPELIGRFKRIKSIDLLAGVAGEQPRAKMILVVDDSLNTREIEKSILELEGHQVVTANDGIEGLERLKEHRFDMIISDIDMPRMDGITMIENVRKDPLYRTTPIVVITSYSEPDVVRRARAAGADEHIVKSDFDRSSLMEITSRLLGVQPVEVS
jgi:two-component system, chemotaxis family, sensor kinase CheA